MHHWQHLTTVVCVGLTLLAVLDAKEIWESLAAVGIKKDVEPWTDIDRRQFARQLDGDERLLHATLEKFPLSFHKEYHWRMVLKLGLPDHVKKSLVPALCYRGAKRMAKAELSQKKEREIA